jgi:helicase MOV-10
MFSSCSFSVAIGDNTLAYGRRVIGRVRLKQSYNGRHQDRVEIIFEDEKLGQQFAIVRSIRATVGSKEDHELLRPTAPFVPRKRTAREPETEILEGVAPPTLKAIKYVVKLGKSEIPKNLSDVLSTGSTSDVVGRVRRMFLPPAWDNTTYGRHFKHLIWIEEYRME